MVALKVEHDFYFYIDFYQLDLVKGKLSWWAAKSSWDSEVDLVNSNSTLTSESEVEFTNYHYFELQLRLEVAMGRHTPTLMHTIWINYHLIGLLIEGVC